MTFCLVLGSLAFDPPKMSRTMRRVTQKEGQEKMMEAKNETLCADFGVVRVFLFNVAGRRLPKSGFRF